jgi:hypothetical protein
MDKKGLDTCEWCGERANNIQTNGGTWLCPSCCPSIENKDRVPENAPPRWHHMSSEERKDWRSGMSMKEIMHKYSWKNPPEPPSEIIH